MNFSSIGDASRQFNLQRQNTDLKNSLNTLSAALSSGQVQDTTRALFGDTNRLSSLEHSLKVLTTQSDRTKETALKIETMQRSLDSFDLQRTDLAEGLSLITRDSMEFQIDEAATNANERFAGFVSALNTQVGGQSLFAGVAFDRPALISGAEMMAEITTAVGAATDADDIIAAITTWFDDPAGGFATVGYTGDTGAQLSRRIDGDTVVSINARADEPGLRNVLKAAAIAAVTDNLSGATNATKATLLRTGGLQLYAETSGVAQVQARLGYIEEQIENVSVTQAAETTALTIALNNITQADPFETATALQAVQTQLEMHYAMTARLSRLSLSEYLR